MQTLSTAVARVCSRLNKNSNDTTVFNRIKNGVNDACMEKWNGYSWSFRWREYPIVLTPQVSSGTLTATNGSQTVTASGTPFIAASHVGAWLQFTGDTVANWYRVLAVNSTSSITIEPAYQGTDGSGKAYYLCPTDYILPSEISDVATIKVTYNRRPLRVTHQLHTDAHFQPTTSAGSPHSATILNQSQALSSYSTGTVSGTINTTTLTGSGTAWLSNVVPGDEIVISGDTNTYRVYSVTSDTSITLYNKLKTTVAALSTYESTRQFGKVLRFSHAADRPYVVFVKGLRAYPPMVNDGDTNELLVRHPHAVHESAVWREAGSSPDPREDSLYMKSEKMWLTAQGEDELLVPYENDNPIWNPR